MIVITSDDLSTERVTGTYCTTVGAQKEGVV